jgi:hypothetical protein
MLGGPKGEKRPADVIGDGGLGTRIATGEETETPRPSFGLTSPGR